MEVNVENSVHKNSLVSEHKFSRMKKLSKILSKLGYDINYTNTQLNELMDFFTIDFEGNKYIFELFLKPLRYFIQDILDNDLSLFVEIMSIDGMINKNTYETCIDMSDLIFFCKLALGYKTIDLAIDIEMLIYLINDGYDLEDTLKKYAENELHLLFMTSDLHIFRNKEIARFASKCYSDEINFGWIYRQLSESDKEILKNSLNS